MSIRTFVAMTTEEESPGVPYWGPNQVTTKLPEGETKVALENLVAGKTYFVKTWNEDEFGNRSSEVVRVINSAPPTREFLFNLSAQGVLDSGSPMRAYLKLPSTVKSVDEVMVTLAFREFFANAQEAEVTGTLTSNSGGGSTSGSSSAGSSGASSSSTSDEETTHVHLVFTFNDSTPPVSTKREYAAYLGGTVNIEASTTNNIQTAPPNPHSHGMAHTHGIPHTHTTPNHTHDIAGHDHALVYGTFEEPYPDTHDTRLRVYRRTTATWTLITTILHLTADIADVNLTDYITGPGDWRIEVQSESGTPNGGRLGLDLYGSVIVRI